MVVMTLALSAPLGLAQTQMPRDILKFIKLRETCDHFRGEEPYDAKRRMFIEQNLKQFCRGTDTRLSRLKKKYKANSFILSKLANYEVEIENP